jgi:tetratricopeptide (TPR) repeat protein
MKSNRCILAMVLIISSILCASTLSRDIYWKDSAEFSGVSLELGISHPPGHPVFPIVGRSLLVLGFPSPEAMNFISAFSAVLAVVLLFRLLLFSGGARERNTPLYGYPGFWGACCGSLFLLTTRGYWIYATHAEVYTPLSLCSLVLWSLFRQHRSGAHERTPAGEKRVEHAGYLLLIAYIAGISPGINYLSIFVIIPLFFTCAADLWRMRHRRLPFSMVTILLFLTGASVFLYLPIRSINRPYYNWGGPDTLRSFLDVLMVKEFATNMFDFRYAAKDESLRILSSCTAFPSVLAVAGIAFFSIIGAARLLRRDAPFGITVLSSGILALVYAFSFGGGIDFEGYLVLPMIVLSILFGGGIASLCAWTANRSRRRSICGTLGMVVTIAFVLRGISIYDDISLRHRHGSGNYARELAASLPPGAVLFTGNTVDYFLINYLIINGEREDLFCVYTPLLRHEWYRKHLCEREDFRREGDGCDDDPEIRLEEWTAMLRKQRILYYTPGSAFFFQPGELIPSGFVFSVTGEDRRSAGTAARDRAGPVDGAVFSPGKEDSLWGNIASVTEEDRGRLFQRVDSLLDGDDNTSRRLSLMLSMRGNYYYTLNLMDESYQVYRKAHELDRQNFSILLNLGRISLARAQYDEALACFEDALELKEKDGRAEKGRANALYMRGKYSEAAASFEKVLSRTPGDVESRFNLSQCHMRTGNIRKATETLRILRAMNPGDLRVRNNLGVCHLHNGDPEQAAREFHGVIEADSTFLEAYHNLSLAYRKMGDHEKAADIVRIGTAHSANKDGRRKNVLTTDEGFVK